MEDKKDFLLFKYPVTKLKNSAAVLGHYCTAFFSFSNILWSILRSDVLPLCFFNQESQIFCLFKSVTF